MNGLLPMLGSNISRDKDMLGIGRGISMDQGLRWKITARIRIADTRGSTTHPDEPAACFPFVALTRVPT